MDQKSRIIAALRAFVAQKPGMEPGNYGSRSAYRAESREVTRDRHIAERLIDAIAWRDGITAHMILDAAERAYSGRLSITERDNGDMAINYCAGQYFAVEYRRAVSAVCASVLWEYVRETSMPDPEWIVERDHGLAVCRIEKCRFTSRQLAVDFANGNPRAYIYPVYPDGRGNWVSAGEWLRTHFRREFGRTIQERFFD